MRPVENACKWFSDMPRPAVILALGLALVGCGADAGSSTRGEQELVAKAKPIASGDFTLKLDRTFIRATQPPISSQAFALKWDASRESSVLFMRSYPAAYHADLFQIAPAKIIGREGLCFGDPHPDNFGFIRIGGRTKFVFNDLDDSGYCPVALDAARYFAILRLYFDDSALTKDVLEQYVDTVKDLSRAQEIDGALVPDWDQVAKDELAQSVANGKLVLGGEVSAASSSERAAVVSLVQTDWRLAGATVLDVAKVTRVSGGSGGLRRFWVLVSRSGRQTILELKEAATPAVDFGRQTKWLGMDQRLAVLKTALWSTTVQDDYFYVQVLGARFLVRNRLAKKSIDLVAMSSKDREDVLRAQASVMARLHAPRWSGVEKDEIRSWLYDSSKVIADRWDRASRD